MYSADTFNCSTPAPIIIRLTWYLVLIPIHYLLFIIGIVNCQALFSGRNRPILHWHWLMLLTRWYYVSEGTWFSHSIHYWQTFNCIVDDIKLQQTLFVQYSSILPLSGIDPLSIVIMIIIDIYWWHSGRIPLIIIHLCRYCQSIPTILYGIDYPLFQYCIHWLLTCTSWLANRPISGDYWPQWLKALSSIVLIYSDVIHCIPETLMTIDHCFIVDSMTGIVIDMVFWPMPI